MIDRVLRIVARRTGLHGLLRLHLHSHSRCTLPRLPAVPAVIVALMSLAMASAAAAQPPEKAPNLEVSFSAAGLMTLRLDGQTLMSGPAQGPPPQALFRDPAERPTLFGYGGKPATIDASLVSDSFDAATGTAIQTFTWGSVTRRYVVAPGRVDCELTVRNESPLTLYQFTAELFSLAVPAASGPARITEATFFGQAAPAMRANNISEPLVLPLIVGPHALVACSDETTRPLELSWNTTQAARPKEAAGRHGDAAAQELADQQRRLDGPRQEDRGQQWRLVVQAGGERLIWHGQQTSRPIEPGQSDTYLVSLRLGRADQPLDPALDVCQAYGRAHTMVLEWDDRRPILRTFIGDWFPFHPPNDQAMTKPTDVAVPEDFRTRVMAAADSLIDNMKRADAQGMVIWNVEGSTVPSIKYVGDPASVEVMCPEMDAVADEYFGRIRRAGFRTGLCIRPTAIRAVEHDGRLEYRHTFPPDHDPVENLSRDIGYAKDRWGCTLFYIDTNSNQRMPENDAQRAWWPREVDGRFKPYNALMSAEQWCEIQRRFPDVLLIPEHSYVRCYMAAAPYDQMNMGSIAGAGVTPAIARAAWPKAFKCLTGDTPLTKYWDRTVLTLAQGDVLMLNSPLEDVGRPLEAAKRLAAYRTAAPDARLAGAPTEKLSEFATDANSGPETRLGAAIALLGRAPVSAATVARLLDSEDWLIRKLAIEAANAPAYAELVPRLLGIAKDRSSSLRFAAADSLAKIDPAAVP